MTIKNANPLYIPVTAAKYANDEFAPDHKNNIVRAGAAAGPLGVVAASTLVHGVKGFKNIFKRNDYGVPPRQYQKIRQLKYKNQSGFLDSSNLSNEV